jgi:DNA-binding transcriptional MocR family regulator
VELDMTPTPFKLERYFARHEFTAKYLLCSSDPESLTVDELLAYEPDSQDGLGRTWLGYTEYPGASELRQELSKRYMSIDPDHIIVHTGAQEAIFSFVNAMLSAGDHIADRTAFSVLSSRAKLIQDSQYMLNKPACIPTPEV